jgi:hypothetical protein
VGPGARFRDASNRRSEGIIDLSDAALSNYQWSFKMIPLDLISFRSQLYSINILCMQNIKNMTAYDQTKMMTKVFTLTMVLAGASILGPMVPKAQAHSPEFMLGFQVGAKTEEVGNPEKYAALAAREAGLSREADEDFESGWLKAYTELYGEQQDPTVALDDSTNDRAGSTGDFYRINNPNSFHGQSRRSGAFHGAKCSACEASCAQSLQAISSPTCPI